MNFQFNVSDNGRVIVLVNGILFASLDGDYEPLLDREIFRNPNESTSWSIHRMNNGHDNKVLAVAVAQAYQAYALLVPYKNEL